MNIKRVNGPNSHGNLFTIENRYNYTNIQGHSKAVHIAVLY